MHGKARLLRAFRHEPLDATPWVPFAGVHAGSLTGHSARQVLTNGDALCAALLAANQLYDPDGQPVVFDLQVEAEILGCDLLWAEKAPPAVVGHPFAETMALPERMPGPDDGRLPMILDAMRRMHAAVGAHTALFGLVTGPLTLASHLRGTELFMDMMFNVDYVAELVDACGLIAQHVAELYIGAGMDIIAVVDPLVSQVGPRHFEEVCSASTARLFSAIRDQGVHSAFFVCGDATKNIAPMCATGPDALFVDENVDLFAAKAITDRYNIAIGGNIPLTTTMLLGAQQDNMKWVVDLLDRIDPHNFILAPGCDMPYDTPVDNVTGIVQAVRAPAATRRIVADYQSLDEAAEIALPDYGNLPRPLVEVFTLDSDTCAACTYMWNAAKSSVRGLEGAVDLVERKYTLRENVARTKQLGVQHLPSIYINGELHYSSLIPSTAELRRAIEERLA
jgi:uroporphyrinogen decarboxylase